MKKLRQPTLAIIASLAIITQPALYAQELPNADINVITEEEKKADNAKTSYNPIMPRIKDAEAVDTLYPDPLADKFQKKSHFDTKERGKSVSQLIEEFESQAAKIASETIIPDNIEEEKIEELSEEDINNQNSEDEDEEESENAEMSEETEEVLYEDNPTAKEYTEKDLPHDDGSEPLPDMLPIIEQTASETSEIASLELPDQEKAFKPQKKKSRKKRKKEEPKYEKLEALEPMLLEDGDPTKDESEADRVIKLAGRIVPEMQAVSRRKQMFRWVLKQDDGNKIPLRSNIKIMQEVKKEDLFEKDVELTGHYQTSGMNASVKYFIVETVNEKKEEEEEEEEKEETKEVTTEINSEELIENNQSILD